MYLFNKFPHPENFSFISFNKKKKKLYAGKHECSFSVSESFNDIYHLQLSVKGINHASCTRSELTPLERCVSHTSRPKSSLAVSADGEISLKNARGKTVLQSLNGMPFGICGSEWMFCFGFDPSFQFYGMGERSTRFEKSFSSHVFWNIDAWSDHDMRIIRKNHYDPDYISVPWVILKARNEYMGILIDSPFCSYISLGHARHVLGYEGRNMDNNRCMYFSSENGAPSLYVIYGPSCREVVRKFQRLSGHVPTPPLWSLGYQQCRWGYRSKNDLQELARNFERHKIPVDGLWLDINYMDGFRVFTFDKKHFPSPPKDIEAIQKQGYKVVPILDPGIKKEPGLPTYEQGKRTGIFCKNPQGTDFVGLVWPGMTVFPDFSMPRGHRWWARQVEHFAQTGIRAAWLDMNDPSTGPVKCTDMLFNKGKEHHDAYHNQYAMLMAKATRDGFQKSFPNERIFLLSRSGFTGSQKWAANWTGDNYSNYYHLRKTIATTINLSLSGMPFNGPDVGGFGDDCSGQLMIDWVKANFLFPFFRNHCHHEARRQEPWVFSKKEIRIIRHFIRLRYKLLPYLYNLFVAQEKEGEPILRPLFYEFSDSKKLPLGLIDDQFMVGPSIMQAPFVDENVDKREVILPNERWYRADTGEWIQGNRRITLPKKETTTPVFFRNRSLIPLQKGIRHTSCNDLSTIELLICMHPQSTGTAEYCYTFDDGISLDYRRGIQTIYNLSARVRKKQLHLKIRAQSEKYGKVRFIPVTPSGYDTLVIDLDGTTRKLHAAAGKVTSLGKAITWYYWK
ncbi:MAG: hypothetical protein GF401_03595 [Chitinivibrionales bacterium]|nr:hypothetical protein [Chitinivibrionales bacterium]